MMKFKDEDTRTFFHLLSVEIQMEVLEFYESLELKGLGLMIEEAKLDETSRLHLVLRVVG